MKARMHTPGPWTAEEYGDFDCPNLVIHSGSEMRVCFMATPGSNGDPAVIEADAFLISAAPDMLAALEYARGSILGMDGYSDVAEQIDAAISKALGTTNP